MAEKTTYKYDAFISYRHSDLDKYVAEMLHKRLEAFKLPSKLKATLVNGERKIKRVFRDEEELPLATNLEDPIVAALSNSDWLIVICTPRLNQSEWCKKEISTFIQLHGRDRVLLILAEGEPNESFPELMKYDEKKIVNEDGTVTVQRTELDPLAADFRGKTKKEINKKADIEVFRLLARMYNVNFDDLRRRHHEIEVRRRIILSTVVAGVSLLVGAIGFGSAVYIAKQNEVIIDQNEEIANKNITLEEQQQQLILNQSQAQADIAEIESATDPLKALKTAYDSATEIDGIEMQYTPKAQRLMTNILHLYDNGSQFHLCNTIPLGNTITEMKASPSGRYSAYRTNSGDCTVIDCEVLNVFKTCRNINSENEYIFAGDDYFIYRDRLQEAFSYVSKITILNLSNGEERSLDVSPYSIYSSCDNSKLICETESAIDIYDLTTLELVFSLNCNENPVDIFLADDYLVFTTGNIFSVDVNRDCENFLYVYSVSSGELVYYECIGSNLLVSADFYDNILCISMNQNGYNATGRFSIALTLNPDYGNETIISDVTEDNEEANEISENAELSEETESSDINEAADDYEDSELPEETGDYEDSELPEETDVSEDDGAIEDSPDEDVVTSESVDTSESSYPLMKLWEFDTPTNGCSDILHDNDIHPEWIFYVYGNSIEALNIYTGKPEFGTSFSSSIVSTYLLDNICTVFLADGTVESANYESTGLLPSRQNLFGIKTPDTKFAVWYHDTYLIVNVHSANVQVYRITASPSFESVDSIPSDVSLLNIGEYTLPGSTEKIKAFNKKYKDIDTDDIYCICYSDDLSLFFVNRNNGEVELYESDSGKLLSKFTNTSGVWYMSCIQNKDYYFVGSFDNVTLMISKETGEIVGDISYMVGANDDKIYVNDDIGPYRIDNPDSKVACIPIYSPEEILDLAKEKLNQH